MGTDRLTRKVASKMTDAGWLEPGEEVRQALASMPSGFIANPSGGATSPQLGLVTELLVVGPLQRTLSAKLEGDGPPDLGAITDPDKMIPGGETTNAMLTMTDRRLIVHEWKGLGKLGERYGEIVRDGCTIVVAQAGSGPSKRRLVHVSGPDGEWVLREVADAGGGTKRVEAFRAELAG